MTKKIVVGGGGSLSLSKSSIKAMKFVDRALGRAKAACSYASSLSNSHHQHLSAISKKFAARSLKVNRGSAKEKEAKQQLQQQPQKKKALSLLSECFLPVSANNDNNYEAVLNGGLLPIAYSARPLPRRFVRGADKTAAVFEAARKKLKLDNHDDDDTTTTTTATIQPSETKKEKNVVCGENVKNYLDALCTQLAEQMNGLEKTVLDDFVTKYVEAKLRTEGAMSKQQRLQTYGMCMFSNVGLREATEQQRKLAKGILDVVGVLIKGGYKLDNMLNEVVMGRYLRSFVDEKVEVAKAEAKYFDMCNKRRLKGLMLKEKLRYILTTKIGLQNALCKFEGRSHTPDKYMDDLKMAAEVATTTRTEIIETMAAARVQVGGNLAIRMETMAKVADNAVIASGHSRLFLSVNEVQWLVRESDVVVMQTVTKVMQEVKAMYEASGVAAERLGIFLDRLNEEDEDEDEVEVDEEQEKKEKEYKKHIGAMIKFFGESAATLCYAAWTLVGEGEEGVNSDLHYDFPGQTPRSVFFFEGEETKKRDVIDPAFECLMANAATVSALADEWISA